GYFATMKIARISGRDFTFGDNASATPVTIVNEQLARHHWPGESAIVQRIRLGPEWMTVVGVVKNVKQSDWIGDLDDEIYLPEAQAGSFSYMTVVLRAHGDPLALAGPVAREVRALDRDVPIAHVQTMQQVIADKLWRERLAMTLLAFFSAV